MPVHKLRSQADPIRLQENRDRTSLTSPGNAVQLTPRQYGGPAVPEGPAGRHLANGIVHTRHIRHAARQRCEHLGDA